MPLQTLLLLSGIILLPLVPAYILYRILPSGAEVDGPFQGLKIKLTGAFGGYFVLAMLSFAVVHILLPPSSDFPKYQEEVFSGTVLLEGASPDDIDHRLLEISLHPRGLVRSGPFEANEVVWTLKVPARRTFDNVVMHGFQDVTIRYPGYFARRLPVREGTMDTDGILRFEATALEPQPSQVEPTRTVEVRDEE